MNVISEHNVMLNASVSLQTIDGVSGLVMESRGGARGKPNERNQGEVKREIQPGVPDNKEVEFKGVSSIGITFNL